MKKSFLTAVAAAWIVAWTGTIVWSQGAATVEPPAAAEAAKDPRLEIPESDDGMPGAGPVRRADWFKGKWRDRRRHFEAVEGDEQGAVVFFGDSITEGWGDHMKDMFAGVKVANRGIGGDTTRGMLYREGEDVIALDPAAVVMLMGTNDLEENADAETIAGNVKLIVDRLKAHNPKMPVILCEVMPSSETKHRPADKIKEINKALAAAMNDEPQVTTIDTWTLFAVEGGDAKKEEFPDLLHPNAGGYAKWAAAVRPVLATDGLMDTEPDNFTPEPGFESLFNGHDLTGWRFVPTSEKDVEASKKKGAPAWPIVEKEERFDGKTETPDGRYVAKNGRLIVTTPQEGRRLQQLWTTREFPKDFVLKLEFRATPNADSGVYIRAPQLQCRDYLLAGPYKKLEHYKPQDWNELVITVSGTSAHCECNGEVLEDHLKIPETGPIGLEGDRGQMEYRRIRVKEGA
ncbi:MAG TPA: GDSL-type esterase/lipase family protein [Lacipirellulaceae bacterium]|jgi:lysophospholipase L1-like esterase